jgi:DNA-binding MurR/RpiR family transcriptional regulator
MSKDSSSKTRHVHRYQSLIQSRSAELSTSEQAVAEHLAAHPEQVPFETAASVAKRVGVSAMTVGRTLKVLGYRGLGDLRIEMRSEMSDVAGAPWVHQGTTNAAPAPNNADRARAMRAELEAVKAIYALSETPMWQAAIESIAAADQVFVIGFQSERGFAIAFADQLAYMRPHVRYLSVENRAFADLRVEASSKSCLVMIDCRRYSRWFRLLSQKASELGVPLVIVTDAYCRWATDFTPFVLKARTDSGRFWDNHAPLACMLSLVVEDVIDRLGGTVYPQLDAVSEFGAAFMGFDRVHRPKNHERAAQEPSLRGRALPDAGKGRSKKSRRKS